MNGVVLKLWGRHAERLMFMVIALLLATIMYYIGWVDESKVIIIGVAMMCFNKARAPEKPEVKNDPGSI